MLYDFHDAEADIRDLVARFAHTVMANDLDSFAQLWTQDAVWQIGEPLPSLSSGRQDIVDMLHRLMNQFGVFAQMTHDGVIRVDGESAAGLWTIEEIGRSGDQGQSYWNIGVYEDRYVSEDGIWHFARRNYRYVWLDDSFLPGRAFFPIKPELPDLVLAPRRPAGDAK